MKARLWIVVLGILMVGAISYAQVADVDPKKEELLNKIFELSGECDAAGYPELGDQLREIVDPTDVPGSITRLHICQYKCINHVKRYCCQADTWPYKWACKSPGYGYC